MNAISISVLALVVSCTREASQPTPSRLDPAPTRNAPPDAGAPEPPAEAKLADQPLFRYAEASEIQVDLQPPDLLIVRWSGKPMYLAGKDDVQRASVAAIVRALEDPDVIDSLARVRTAYAADFDGTIDVGGKLIGWRPACEKCLRQPRGVKRLGALLHAMMERYRRQNPWATSR